MFLFVECVVCDWNWDWYVYFDYFDFDVCGEVVGCIVVVGEDCDVVVVFVF